MESIYLPLLSRLQIITCFVFLQIADQCLKSSSSIMMSVCLSLSLLVCVSSLLVSIPLVRAQESFCKTKLGNADKSDSSHAGQYHYFTVSCINNTFAMLNVEQTGKYYSSVTIEMTCTNELLNTTNTHTLILLSNYIDGDIPVHYDLRPGTVCIFYGCVRASRKGYMYNNEEASCSLPQISSTSDYSSSAVLPSSIVPSSIPPSIVTSSIVPSLLLSGISSLIERSTVSISEHMSTRIGRRSTTIDITSGITLHTSSAMTSSTSTGCPLAISTALPTCSCSSDSVLLANSMLIVCGIFGAVILVFSSTIVIFTIALCCMHPYTSRQVTPNDKKTAHLEPV